MAEKVTLSNHWLDEEGWAGKPGERYKPRDTVSLEDPGHAMLLRQAGYEASDVEPTKKAAAPRAKKSAAKKAAAPAAPSA